MVILERTEALFQRTGNILNTPNQNFWDYLKKVEAVALVILAIFPMILCDLAAFAARKIYQICYPPEEKKPLDDATVRQVTLAPRVYYGIEPQGILEQALKHAFSHLDRSTKALYRDLILNDGESDLPHLEQTTPNIFQWCAAVYLAYLLRLPFIQESYLRDENQLLTIRDLQTDYRKLSLSEQATALLTIYRQPTSEWQLTEKAYKIVQEIQAVAHGLTQNRQYLNLYGPVSRRINQIFI